MIRNFVTGIVVGGVVAAAGLGVVSQMAPLPNVQDEAEVVVVAPSLVPPVTQIEPEISAAPEPAASTVAPTVLNAPDPAIVPAKPAAVLPEIPSETLPDATAPTPPPAPVVVAPQASADAPSGLQNPGAETTAPVVEAQTEQARPAILPSVLPPDAGTDPAPAKADLPPPAPEEVAETLLTPVPEVAEPPPGAMALDSEPAPETAAEPAPMAMPDPAPAAQAEVEPAPLPKVLDTAQPETLAPSAGLTKSVDGVTVGRLPSIAAAVEPAAEAAVATAQAPADDRALTRFAASFSNDLAKPMFAVLLVDSGAADIDRAKLAALPFPVSFVIDPLDPGAAAAEAVYRAAGKEVVMLASGIPAGATAGDLEQTFQANAAVLPEAVAVMDLGAQGFQDNRPLASMVVPIIKDQGRGMVTFDAGLNAADQVARREDVPAAVIFRDLDGAGEDTPLIRRYLDRAAFKAAQEGRVVVVGTMRPETIAALMEWTVEGKAASVALAPISAVLSVK